MRFDMTFSKALRRSAAEKGKGLFGVSIDTRAGRMEVTGPMEHATAEMLLHFAARLYKGTPPPQAFEETFGQAGPPEAGATTRDS